MEQRAQEGGGGDSGASSGDGPYTSLVEFLRSPVELSSILAFTVAVLVTAAATAACVAARRFAWGRLNAVELSCRAHLGDVLLGTWARAKKHHNLIIYYLLSILVFLQACAYAGRLLAVVTNAVSDGLEAVTHPMTDAELGALVAGGGQAAWWPFARSVAASSLDGLAGKLYSELLCLPIIEKFTWQWDTEAFTEFILEGGGAISIFSKLNEIRAQSRDDLTFLKHGFAGRVVVSMNLIDNTQAGTAGLAFRTVKDMSLGELLPDKYARVACAVAQQQHNNSKHHLKTPMKTTTIDLI